MTTYSRMYACAAAAVSVCVMLSGCSVFSASTLHKSAKGTVYLEDVVDWAYDASHPAVIDQTTLHKIVMGLYVEDGASPTAKMPAAGSKPMRVFSDEDAVFLAPLLAQGLSKAKPEQLVGFTLPSSTGSGTEPTAGTIYVYQGAIHVTITPSRAIKAAGFIPGTLVHTEKAPPYAAGGSNGATSLVIDYQALANMPSSLQVAALATPAGSQGPRESVMKPAVSTQDMTAPAQAIPASTSAQDQFASSTLNNDEILNKKLDELQSARAANEAKTNEIRVLRKELEWMKRELRERTDEIKAMQTKTASKKTGPKKKPAEAQLTR